MSFKYKLLFLFFFVCFTKSNIAQSIDYYGTPHIENFDPNDNFGGKYIWSVCQDPRGIMYFGDREGILEFDGSTWRRHTIPNKSVVRSLASDTCGTIYVGANNDFGYLKPDSIGTLNYHSLHDLVPENTPYFQSIWQIFTTKQGVYFISQKKIFRFFNNTIEVIPVDMGLPCASYANETIYIRDKKHGFATIQGNKIIPLSNCEEINAMKRKYFFVHSISPEEVIISFSLISQYFKYNNITKKITTFDLPEATSSYLNEKLKYHNLKIDNNRIAVATTKGGVVILDENNEIVRIINEKRGLISNNVYSLFLDAEKNLWAVTKKGISRIDISYPALFYNKLQGIETDVTCSKYYNGIQYIGTDTKLYYLPTDRLSAYHDNHPVKTVKFPFDNNQISDVNGHLLVSNWYGLSEIKENNAEVFYNKDIRVFCSGYDKRYPNKIVLGQNHALVVCTFKDAGPDSYIELTDTFKIHNNLSQIRSMAFDDEGNLWLASYNEGIYLIRFKDKTLKNYSIVHLTEKNGLPKEIQESFIDKFNNNINVFTPKGIYKPIYPSKNNLDSAITFKHDPYWGSIFTTDSCGVKIAKKINNNAYFIHGDKTGILNIKGDSALFDYKPFLKLNDILSASVENNRYINIGGSEYFCIYDTHKKKDVEKPFRVLIRQVLISSDDSLLFNGSYYDDDCNKVIIDQIDKYKPIIEHKYNSLRFNFSANFFESSHNNQYRFMVEGFDKTWSPWSTEPSAIYTNLPHGKYTFKVMGKNLYGTLSQVTTYKFTIKPAWYQTKWAYLLYCILSILFIAFVAKIYNRALSQQNNKLESLVKNRTHELENTIVQLKETQSSLVQQEKMASLGILTAGVAHEINNPLNYILGGYTGLEIYFQEQNVDDEDIEILMDSIKIGVERAAEIVSGLNQFSRTKNTFDEKCDLHSILDNSILMIKHLLKNKIELVKKYDASNCSVLGNVGKLHQVFINVLTNACHALPNQGMITVDTTVKDNNLIIKIIDTGEGIDEEHMNKITDPFFTTKEPGKGSGLGLSITYKIIEEHNGKLEFESELDKGTSVIIQLPLIKS